MKQWTVYYRNANGTEESQVFEADGKPEVFAILKQKGISAVRIVEGASAASRRNAAVAPSAKRGLVAGLAVVILAAGAYFLFFSGSGKPEKPSRGKASSAIKEVRPAATHKPAPSEGSSGKSATADYPDRQTIPVGNVITAGVSMTGRIMTLADGTVVTNSPRRIFERDFEKGLMLAMRPGSMSGTFLQMLRKKYSDDQILSMLKEITRPSEGDDESAANIKNRVQKLKEEILISIQNGASVSEIFDRLRARRVEDGLTRAAALKARQEALRSGDPELARESVEKVNSILQRRGLNPMPVPGSAGKEQLEPKQETINETPQGENE